jgi:hypothetical protein
VKLYQTTLVGTMNAIDAKSSELCDN